MAYFQDFHSRTSLERGRTWYGGDRRRAGACPDGGSLLFFVPSTWRGNELSGWMTGIEIKNTLRRPRNRGCRSPFAVPLWVRPHDVFIGSLLNAA